MTAAPGNQAGPGANIVMPEQANSSKTGEILGRVPLCVLNKSVVSFGTAHQYPDALPQAALGGADVWRLALCALWIG